MPEVELESPAQKYSAKPGQVMAFIWRVASKHWISLSVILVAGTLAPIANVFTPIAMKQLVDAITGQTPSQQIYSQLLPVLFFLVGIRLVSLFLWRITGYVSAWASPRISADLEARGMEGLMRRSYAFFIDEPAGKLVRRVNTLNFAYNSLHSSFFWSVLSGLVSAISIIIVLLYSNPAAAALVAGWGIVLIAGNYFLSKWKLPIDEIRSREQSAATGVLADILSNALTVKLFSRSQDESQSYRKRLDVRVAAEHAAWRRTEHGMTATDFSSAFLNACLLFLALWGWERGQVTVGDFVLLQGFVIILFEQLNWLGQSYRHSVEALADASEIVGILNTPLEIKEAPDAKPLRLKEGKIFFQDVTFSYGGASILKKFLLEVAPREKIALVGPSGAGKSTVIKLLLRFYDVNKGNILIDNQDISKVTQDSLREAVSLVPQDPLLFHRSLRENIAYGYPKAKLDEIIEASKKAHCHAFISKLPKGYDTLVGERGVKLSGGERQRVAIARAILADAPILILDEATSSLDSESEMLIQAALKELMKNKTVIVIAHRLSTIMDMDRIIVMEGGKITDQGTHQQLTSKVGKYRDLWHIQAGGFQK